MEENIYERLKHIDDTALEIQDITFATRTELAKGFYQLEETISSALDSDTPSFSLFAPRRTKS